MIADLLVEEPQSKDHYILKSYLQKFDDNEQEIEEILQHFIPFEVKKGTRLLQIGEVSSTFYYICKGGIRSFFLKPNGEEVNRSVVFEGRFYCSTQSMFDRVLSKEGLETVKYTRGLRIDQSDYFKLLQKNLLARKVSHHHLMMAFNYNSWRLETLLTMTGQEKYEYILQEHPEYAQRLSNKDLSSFLGMTEGSLSRIKASR